MNNETKIEESQGSDATGLGSSDLLGCVVRLHDKEGGARILGTSKLALHAVLSIDGLMATVALVGDDNLSEVPLSSLVRATPSELRDYIDQEWQRGEILLPNA